MGLAIADAGSGVVTSVDLDDLKQHLQMSLTKTNNDTELLRFLRAAEVAIGHRTGPLVPVEVTERHNGGGTCIVLRQPRAVSLTSVSYADSTTGSLADFDLDPDTGILYLAYGGNSYFTSGSRFVSVTYTAGFSEVPEDLKQAVKELVRHLWETQRGGGTSTRASFPGDDIDGAPMPGAFSSWPIRVQELIAPYTVPSVA